MLSHSNFEVLKHRQISEKLLAASQSPPREIVPSFFPFLLDKLLMYNNTNHLVLQRARAKISSWMTAFGLLKFSKLLGLSEVSILFSAVKKGSTVFLGKTHMLRGCKQSTRGKLIMHSWKWFSIGKGWPLYNLCLAQLWSSFCAPLKWRSEQLMAFWGKVEREFHSPLAAALRTWSYIWSPQHFSQPFSFLHLQNIFVDLQRSFLPSSNAFRSLPIKHGCRD